MKQSQYGPCGIFCEACGAEDCDGCRSTDVDEYVANCTFRTCAREKTLEFCCFCEDYPCKELDAFMHDEWPHHWTMEPNLAFIREHGVDEWLSRQRREWTCEICGRRILWYQKQCACGNKLDAWRPPA